MSGRRTEGADYSVSLEEGLDIYDRAEARALKRLQDAELELRMEPPRTATNKVYDGRVPLNLPSLPPSEIGEYYGLQVGYTDYVAGQAVLARTEMLAAEEKLNLVKAAVRKSKLGTAQEKGDGSIIDERYVHANAAYIEAKTYYELLSTIEEAARRDVKFISRIIETKRMELEMGFRGGNVRLPNQERPGASRFAHREHGRDRESERDEAPRGRRRRNEE